MSAYNGRAKLSYLYSEPLEFPTARVWVRNREALANQDAKRNELVNPKRKLSTSSQELIAAFHSPNFQGSALQYENIRSSQGLTFNHDAPAHRSLASPPAYALEMTAKSARISIQLAVRYETRHDWIRLPSAAVKVQIKVLSRATPAKESKTTRGAQNVMGQGHATYDITVVDPVF